MGYFIFWCALLFCLFYSTISSFHSAWLGVGLCFDNKKRERNLEAKRRKYFTELDPIGDTFIEQREDREQGESC